ncbi:MAG: NAD(P)-dependent oxidoreductase [Planctomycetota bacterium]
MESNAREIPEFSVAWVGAGIMGRSMCGHLLAAEYPVTVHTRTRSKAGNLLDRGARWAGSPREAAAAADVTFAMAGFPHEVREVFLGTNGILAGARPGSVIVDMATSPPSLAAEIAAAAKARGVTFLDAPVTGGDVGAREAKLSIMAGGDEAAFRRVLPLFQKMGKTVMFHGPAGAGQHAKLVNQTFIAGTMIGLAEGLLYAYKAGLNMNRVMESVASGAAGSWSLSNYAPRVLAGNFEPGFLVEHLIKDLGLVLEECRRMNITLPGVELAHSLYQELARQGHARKGTQSLILALTNLSKVEWPGSEGKRNTASG